MIEHLFTGSTKMNGDKAPNAETPAAVLRRRDFGHQT
jgi:hypothetical protein